MGREATAIVHWGDVIAEAKVLLESDALILRGGIKDRIPRSEIAEVKRTDLGIALTVAKQCLLIEMHRLEADRWGKALTTPPPSLASKLGISADRPAFVLGTVDDAALATALSGNSAATIERAAAIIAVLRLPSELEAVLALAASAPRLLLWCIHEKGKHAAIGEATVRSVLRAHNYIDTKASGVSPRLTATRYILRGNEA